MPAKASRVAFGEALVELGAKDERIVTLDADLSKSTMTTGFAKQFPGRAFNLGIAESNMIGIAAGLALTGRVPFACSFACFIVGRFETIRISVAYTNANVKIVGTHVGVASGGTVFNTLEAARRLSSEGISAEVINAASIKPLDEEMLGRSAAKTGRVVTVEDHSVAGGLGGAVAEWLSEVRPTPLKRIGT